MKEYQLKARRLAHKEILAYAPHGTRLPEGLEVWVANDRYKEALIKEALKALNVPDQEWARRINNIPTTSLHTVQTMHYTNKESGDPDVVVKGIHSAYGAETVERYGKIFQYLTDNEQHCPEYFGHIVGLPEPVVDEGKKEGKSANELRDLDIDAFLGGHPIGKVFTSYVKGKSLDDEEVTRLSEARRRTILRNLAARFAFFHGAGDTHEEKKKTQSQRKKPRYYINMNDRRLSNFMYDRYGRVYVIDPESWEFFENPQERKERDFHLKHAIRHATALGLVQSLQDVRVFSKSYLSNAVTPQKGKGFKAFSRPETLADHLWKDAQEYKEMSDRIRQETEQKERLREDAAKDKKTTKMPRSNE